MNTRAESQQSVYYLNHRLVVHTALRWAALMNKEGQSQMEG
jgi:hypothetical protein